MEEDWQDPLLDVSIPYKSLAPLALTCCQLDEDLQNLISFFSTLSKEDSACHINGTSFESSLRILKDVLLVSTQKCLSEDDNSFIWKDLFYSEDFNKELTSKKVDSCLKHSLNESVHLDNNKTDTYEANAGKQQIENGIKCDFNYNDFNTNIQDNAETFLRTDLIAKATNSVTENSLNRDDSKLLMAFFRELEAAKLFENLDSFSGILTAHSIHLRIIQEVVNDIFRVEELRLRLCSQLAALINPIILSRLESYKNSLFCTAFTIPNNSELGNQFFSLPDPRLYQWPSCSDRIDEYKKHMSKLPLLCFSETCDLGSCISKSFETHNFKQNKCDLSKISESDLKIHECSIRVKSLDFIFNEEGFVNQSDHPLFLIDGTGNNHNNNFHLPLCMDIAQDSKDIERDILYVNGKEYNGATDGYEKIIYVVANLIENYWLNRFKRIEDDTNELDSLNKCELNSNYTIELSNKSMSNYIDYNKDENYKDRNTDSVIISIILLHIMSRTYSGGACFDKVSLLYSKPDCIVISPHSKRARPLEIVILPNIALMLSTLRFRLYEVMDNLSVNTLPCYLVDTHVVSRLIPNLEFVEALPTYSFHILSRTPVNKIPESIFLHLVRSANLFISNNIIFMKIKVENENCNTSEYKNKYYSEQELNRMKDSNSELANIQCSEVHVETCSEFFEVNLNGTLVNELNSTNKCLYPEQIMELTGDDLTMITPGEAALFRMLTNIQDKDTLQNTIENVNLTNSEGSTSREIQEDLEETFINFQEVEENSEIRVHCEEKEFMKNDSTFISSNKLSISPSTENNEQYSQLESQNVNLTLKNDELKDVTDLVLDQTELHNNSNLTPKDLVFSEKSSKNSLNNQSFEVNELESKENNEQNSVILNIEGAISNNRKIPKLYFGENFNLPSACILNSNIYIASSENSTNLASDLCNLPTDSIGAIDQENQQHALLLQSKRVISQFSIFNNIINT